MPLEKLRKKQENRQDVENELVWVLGYLFLGGIILAGASLAVMSRRLFLAVASLGIGSAALATLFFWLGAPYAGGFELSVGAGLISVLFIIIISLTETTRSQQNED